MKTFSPLMVDAEREGEEGSSGMLGFSALGSVEVGEVAEGQIRPSVVAHV